MLLRPWTFDIVPFPGLSFYSMVIRKVVHEMKVREVPYQLWHSLITTHPTNPWYRRTFDRFVSRLAGSDMGRRRV